MDWIDAAVAASLIPLAVWILLSGLDDLVLDAVCLRYWLQLRWQRRCPFQPPLEEQWREVRQARVAIFVPLWHEHKVIGGMLEHNTAAIKYSNYDFFIGAYPNDHLTIEAIREAEARFPNVHLATCPHDGPTSKADNLNWIYQRMLLYEEERECHFDIVVTHDAEDLIHSEALGWINYFMQASDMVQIPVLALPTPLWEFTHGVYCDDFCEYQTKDMLARQLLGGFIPSNGVGTGYSRRALEALASASGNRIFEPTCLTEDYENGLRLHRLRALQRFVPITRFNGSFVATREYFPRRFKAAVRQRTRWITGISLQSWERNGWRGGWRQKYWFWRDRKGLVGNPVSLLANWILIYGVATYLWSRHAGTPWGLAEMASHWAGLWLLWATLFLQLWRTAVRMACVTRVYGFGFAAAVPLRTLWANWINCLATVSAVKRFALAKLRGRPLVWIKTEHAYPSRGALMEHKQRLGEILVKCHFLAPEEVESALAAKPPDVRLGEHLIRQGRLSEEQVYEALSRQQNIPLLHLDSKDVRRRVARTLPAAVSRQWKVLPFRISAGSLFLASAELPTDEMQQALRQHVKLEVRFQLITAGNYERLERELLRS